MKINEIINHEKLLHGEEKWFLSSKEQDIVNFIRKNCSQILEIYNWEGKYLYRGLRKQQSAIVLARSRDDRKPMDTPEDTQHKIDSRLKEAGFKALRSNSIFCSSSFKFVHDYGTPFIIFPINDFNYTWCDRVKDLYTHWMLRKDNSLFMKMLNDDNLTSTGFVNTFGFKNNEGLNIALKKENEVYICGSYVAIDCESDIFIKIMTGIGLSLPDWSSYYGTQEDDETF